MTEEIECPMCHYRFDRNKQKKINIKNEIIDNLIEVLESEKEAK